MLASLASGYFFFVKDMGDKSKLRLLVALKTRVCTGLILILLIFYGIVSGKLSNRAPWDNKDNQDNKVTAIYTVNSLL